MFYKVKPEYDQKYKNPKVHDCNIYIANEIYTEGEILKENLNKAYMEPVDVAPETLYFCFGARFSSVFD